MTMQPLARDLASAQRLSVAAIVFLILGVMGAAVAFGFAAYAGHIALAARFPPEQAALIVAGTALAAALVMALAGWLAIRGAKRRVSRGVSSAIVSVAGPAALSLIARNTRLAGAAAALAVGVFAARRARD